MPNNSARPIILSLFAVAVVAVVAVVWWAPWKQPEQPAQPAPQVPASVPTPDTVTKPSVEPSTLPPSTIGLVGDLVLGDEAAPVTVIEYASFTCPHCAHFHIDSWPKLKAEYVDTGKVRYILREVYFDQFGLWASMVARCGGAQAYYPLAEQYMKQQSQWTRVPPEQIGAEIQKIGRMNGLSAQQLGGCLSDQDYAKALIKSYQDNAGADEVSSTPTFLINGEKVAGNKPEEIFALIDKHL